MSKKLSVSRNDKAHGKTPSEQLRAKQQQLLKRRDPWDDECCKPKRAKITSYDHARQHASSETEFFHYPYLWTKSRMSLSILKIVSGPLTWH